MCVRNSLASQADRGGGERAGVRLHAGWVLGFVEQTCGKGTLSAHLSQQQQATTLAEPD